MLLKMKSPSPSSLFCNLGFQKRYGVTKRSCYRLYVFIYMVSTYVYVCMLCIHTYTYFYSYLMLQMYLNYKYVMMHNELRDFPFSFEHIMKYS